jgi:heme acquisition protein HasR
MIGTNKFCSPMAYLGGAMMWDRSDFILVNGDKEYKNIPHEKRNKEITCGGIMGNASYMPADRGTLTLGTRALDRKLDIGLRLRYSRGHSEKRNYDTLDQAMWPSYQVYDIYTSYSPSQNINLSLLLDNATDVAYIPAMGDLNNLTLARGRTLTGSMEYRF